MKRQPRLRLPLVAMVGFATVAFIAVILAVATNGSSDEALGSSEDIRPPQVSAVEPDGSVIPDADFKAALRSAGFSTRGWETDSSRHLVPFDEIFSGGPPKDGIPAIDKPKFTDVERASGWLGDREPVIATEIDGDARAYPLRILTQHEIVNDTVGGTPVVVTFCPLCNSAIMFERTLDGVVLDFGTTGNLRLSDLVMYDRTTETWWQQFIGQAIVGELAGRTLTALPSSIIAFEDFAASNPDGKVLSRDTGFSRNYSRSPYVGYDDIDSRPFLFRGVVDGRIAPKERIAAVTVGGEDVAFPFSVLEQERVVNYEAGGDNVAVFFKPGTLSSFGQGGNGDPREVGATGVFESTVGERKLSFRADGDTFVDNETGTVWNILGEATDGPLEGEKLTPVVHANHFWFAWGAFKPDTIIYQGVG